MADSYSFYDHLEDTPPCSQQDLSGPRRLLKGTRSVCAAKREVISNPSEVNNDARARQSPIRKNKSSSILLASSDEWECSTCTLLNNANDSNCVACDTPYIEHASAPKSRLGTIQDRTWKCLVCTLENVYDRIECDACGEPRPLSNALRQDETIYSPQKSIQHSRISSSYCDKMKNKTTEVNEQGPTIFRKGMQRSSFHERKLENDRNGLCSESEEEGYQDDEEEGEYDEEDEEGDDDFIEEGLNSMSSRPTQASSMKSSSAQKRDRTMGLGPKKLQADVEEISSDDESDDNPLLWKPQSALNERELTPQPSFPEISKHFWTVSDLTMKSTCRIPFHEYRLDAITGASQPQQAEKRKMKREANKLKADNKKSLKRKAKGEAGGGFTAKKKWKWGGPRRAKK